ncbi:hypothetical protein ACTPEM_22640, partial [Clostridioides difficile]
SLELVLREACNIGFDKVKNIQRKKMNEFWTTSDVEIEGDKTLPLALQARQVLSQLSYTPIYKVRKELSKLNSRQFSLERR